MGNNSKLNESNEKLNGRLTNKHMNGERRHGRSVQSDDSANEGTRIDDTAVASHEDNLTPAKDKPTNLKCKCGIWLYEHGRKGCKQFRWSGEYV